MPNIFLSNFEDGSLKKLNKKNKLKMITSEVFLELLGSAVEKSTKILQIGLSFNIKRGFGGSSRLSGSSTSVWEGRNEGRKKKTFLKK